MKNSPTIAKNSTLAAISQQQGKVKLLPILLEQGESSSRTMFFVFKDRFQGSGTFHKNHPYCSWVWTSIPESLPGNCSLSMCAAWSADLHPSTRLAGCCVLRLLSN